MALHVDSSTIRNQTVLAHVLDPVDDATSDRTGSSAGGATSSTDSAAISAHGQRLAAIGDHGSELSAIYDAESLVRSISAGLRSANSSSTAALHGSVDRSRAAALLVD